MSKGVNVFPGDTQDGEVLRDNTITDRALSLPNKVDSVNKDLTDDIIYGVPMGVSSPTGLGDRLFGISGPSAAPSFGDALVADPLFTKRWIYTAVVGKNAYDANNVELAKTLLPQMLGPVAEQGVRTIYGNNPDDKPWGAAWGIEGRRVTSTTFNQAVTAAAGIDLTGLTITWTPVPGRQYEVVASGLIAVQTVASGTMKGFITDATPTNLCCMGEAILAISPAIGGRCILEGSYLNPASLAATAITWKLRVSISAGTCTISGDTSSQISFYIKDIGPF